MKNACAIVVGLAVFGICLTGRARAQDRATIPDTYVHSLHSKVNGVEYKLTVVLPPDYAKRPTVRYPVLYLLDGNEWASLLGIVLPRLWYFGTLPKIIVVGIDYPGSSGREQDYGPLTQTYFPMSRERGAANFMRVVRQEIIPFVDSRYRTDPTDRGIGGHSLGGLFSAYALLHDTDTFRRFWLSSPTLIWNDQMLFKDFASFNQERVAKPIYVFTDVGADEVPSMISTLERFDREVLERHSDRVVLEELILPGETHATVVTAAFIRALEHLYMYKPRVISDPADLQRFSGRYRLPDGTIVTLVTDGRDLLYGESRFEFPYGSLVRMSAYGARQFFMNPGVEIEFPPGLGHPSRLRYDDLMGNKTVEAVRLP